MNSNSVLPYGTEIDFNKEALNLIGLPCIVDTRVAKATYPADMIAAWLRDFASRVSRQPKGDPDPFCVAHARVKVCPKCAPGDRKLVEALEAFRDFYVMDSLAFDEKYPRWTLLSRVETIGAIRELADSALTDYRSKKGK